jgi:hypothetical protein
MSSSVGWLPLVFTTLGGGVVGSLIATYGSQARDRRAARCEAMESIQRFELARGQATYHEIFECDNDSLIEVETRCLLAGIPRYLVDLYKMLNRAKSQLAKTSDPDSSSDPDFSIDEEEALGSLVMHEAINRAAGLLASAIWHPWLTAPLRRWRAWRLRRLFFIRNRKHISLKDHVSELLELKRYRAQSPSSDSDDA